MANVKTQEGTEAINEYIKALKRKALAEAAQPKMAALLKERMEITEGYQAAKEDVNKYRLEKKKNKYAGQITTVNQGSALGTTTTTDFAAESEKTFKRYVDKDVSILNRIKNLDNILAQQLSGLAPKALVAPKPEGKNYWLKILDDQQTTLNKLDAGAKDFEKKSKPIIASINKTKKILSKYDPIQVKKRIQGSHKTVVAPSNVDIEDQPPLRGKPLDELSAPTDNLVKASLDQSVQQSLNQQRDIQVTHTKLTQEEILKIETDYTKKKAKLEDDLATSKIHAGDKFIDAALKNSKKDSTIFKAAFLAKKTTSIADTIISTKRAVMESLKAYAGIPFIGQALGIAQAVFMGAQGASSIAEIAKQKPGFAAGGQFRSDGKGALLPGYSRTDNTNAYLRSGEAVVVSEAMRNPWARNLVSAINVAYGGRDFSMTNPGRGYAIGGIFTDGGNSNRYYSQPMNDAKDLANTIAYQMVNNFPPIYVDVKDVNNQQNILAQTVNRVNL